MVGSQMAEEREDFDHLIASLATAANKATAAALAPHGLSPLAFGILSWCHRGEAHSVSELAEVFPVDASAISRQVSRLADRGLLRKQRTSKDQRLVQLSLTEEGLFLAQMIEERLKSSRSLIMEGVTDDEWTAFTATARRIQANLEEIAKRLRYGRT